MGLTTWRNGPKGKGCHIPMTMEDWASKLDAILQFNDAEVLQDKGKVTAVIVKAFAESEFEQYRVIQDRLYQIDFDRLIETVDCDGDCLK